MKSGHTVYGVDSVLDKVEAVRAGRSPIVEPGIAELLEQGVREGRLDAGVGFADRIADADLAIVCVGTPSLPDGSHNMSYIANVARQIADALHAVERPGKPLTVAFRSTMRPGSIENLVWPIFVRRFGEDTAGQKVALVYNPEFLREIDRDQGLLLAAQDRHGHPRRRAQRRARRAVRGHRGAAVLLPVPRQRVRQVHGQRIPRAQGGVRQRGRPRGGGARRLRRGDAPDLHLRHQAQRLGLLPAAGRRLRRLVPAQGRARVRLSRARGGEGYPGDRRAAAVEQMRTRISCFAMPPRASRPARGC